MAYRIKKRKRDEIDDVYDIGIDVVERINPFFMLTKAKGIPDENLEKIHRGESKISTTHLDLLESFGNLAKKKMPYKIYRNKRTHRYTIFNIVKGKKARIVAGGFKTKSEAQKKVRSF